jgi:tetratricopeptide (TPR) repeat protein
MREDVEHLVLDLSERLRSAREPGRQAELLDPAVPAQARELATILADGSGDMAVPVEALGVLVAIRWVRSQSLSAGHNEEDLRECLRWSSVLLPSAPHLVPEPVRAYLTQRQPRSGMTAARADNRGVALFTEHQRTGEIQALHDAVAFFRHAADAASPEDPDRPRYLSNLASALGVRGTFLLSRFGYTGNQADIDLAIGDLRDALDTIPASHANRLSIMSNLGIALKDRFECTGDRSDLDDAIAQLSGGASSQQTDHPDFVGCVSNLGNALLSRFKHRGDPADLDRAIASYQTAIDATPAGHHNQPTYLANLGAALLGRFERTGQRADLDNAIASCQRAVDVAPAGHPGRPGYVASLGSVLGVRFRLTGQLPDLDASITWLSEAVEATPVGHPDRNGRLDSLGAALLTRFNHTGQRADLDNAITNFHEALDSVPSGHPDRPRYLSNLGICLKDRFDLAGEMVDLDQAIGYLGEAAEAIPEEHYLRSAVTANLGVALHNRFKRHGQQTDLDQALAYLREGLLSTPAEQPARALIRANLGVAWLDRFNRYEQKADLDRAVIFLREALNSTPVDHTERPGMLANLANALRTRYTLTGRQTDLDEAISRYSEAAERTPAKHPDRPAMLAGLANALRIRHGISSQRPDLDQAIVYLHEAVGALATERPVRSSVLVDLATALQIRFEHAGQRDDLDGALDAFREGASIRTAPPRQRIAAARGWGKCALLAGDADDAVEGYTTAIELLPLAAWHGLDRDTRERHLREWAGLASDAAAAAVIAGRPARAVELLEAGRSLLWTDALNLRQDLTALEEQAPDLAAALEASRAVLDALPTRTQAPEAERRMLEARRQAAHDWDAAVERVRGIDGFEHFLRPVPLSAMRAAASDGPVVIVNVSEHGSQALIIGGEPGEPAEVSVRVVDLPDAPRSTVIDQANALLRVLHGTSGGMGNDNAVFDVLAWAWHSIADPVLTAIGRTHSPDETIENWPRIWWCPTGPATVLPLHAAGLHPRSTAEYRAVGDAEAIAQSVAGRVVSSYVQTLTAMVRARGLTASEQVRLLAVGVPDAPGYIPGASSLPGVQSEFAMVARHWPAPGRATVLLGTDATRNTVVAALPSHSWVHISSHGVQDLSDASLSAFLLDDQPLTLADISTLNLHEIDLAYLAACQTAAGDLKLLDEALHLAGALQLVGYRHVLATMWSISDAAAPILADIIYGHLHGPDGPRADRAPYALHNAVAHLRRKYPVQPLLWAPYIHLGP